MNMTAKMNMTANEPDPIIGIDIGFSKCIVGLYRTTGFSIARNKQGNSRIPSCVGIEGGEFVVGENAQRLSLREPGSVAFGIPRLLGKFSREKKDLVTRMGDGHTYQPFELQNDGKGRFKVILNDGNEKREFTVVQLFSELLKHLVSLANALLSNSTNKIVVTIPRSAEDISEDIKDSVKKLGLDLIALLPEPEAVITAYRHDIGLISGTKHITVVDFGAGSLVLSMWELSAGGTKLITSKSYSDVRGSLFDDKIVKDFLEKAKGKHNTELSPDVLAEVRHQCEEAKIALSDVDSTSIPISCIDPYNRRDKIELSVRKFKSLCGQLIDKIADHIQDFQKDLKKKDLPGEVLLFGGMSSSPYIKTLITKYLRCSCDDKLDKHEACAAGAAICGWDKSGGAKYVEELKQKSTPITHETSRTHIMNPETVKSQHINTVNVCPFWLRVYNETAQKWLDEVLIEENTPLPYKTRKEYKLNHPEPITLALYAIYSNADKPKRLKIENTEIQLKPDAKDFDHAVRITVEIRDINTLSWNYEEIYYKLDKVSAQMPEQKGTTMNLGLNAYNKSTKKHFLSQDIVVSELPITQEYTLHTETSSKWKLYATYDEAGERKAKYVEPDAEMSLRSAECGFDHSVLITVESDKPNTFSWQYRDTFSTTSEPRTVEIPVLQSTVAVDPVVANCIQSMEQLRDEFRDVVAAIEEQLEKLRSPSVSQSDIAQCVSLEEWIKEQYCSKQDPQ